jgi:hypothetical protein
MARNASTVQTPATWRAHQRAARRKLTRMLLGEPPLGGLARRALLARITARLHHLAEHVVRELDAPEVEGAPRCAAGAG